MSLPWVKLMQPLKISIVIPTRDRGIYLIDCIRTCLMCQDPHIEVIVSDNNSSDDTRAKVDELKDSRLRYFNTGESLSMRQNFEFALSHATGDYIIFIGDDDGVLPHGLATLRRLLEKHAPDVVTWRHITYKWPRTQPVTPGILKFRYRDFFGPMESTVPSQRLASFCRAETINYRDGANIYHGCVNRRIIEQVKARTGEYFMDQIPDVYVAMANLTAAEKFLWIRNPVTVAGESEKSNGAAITTTRKQTNAQAAIATSFKSLSNIDPVKHPFDVTVRSIPAYTYAILNKINVTLCDGQLDINHARWRDIIVADLQKFVPDIRAVNLQIMYDYFASVDHTFNIPALPDMPVQENLPEAVLQSKLLPVQTTARNMTVESVVRWLTQVTGHSYLPSLFKPVAKVRQWQAMLGMYWREKFFN